jgi:DNA repair protein RadA
MMSKVEMAELDPYSLEGIAGIGPTTIKTLAENGIKTMYDVVALTPTTIAQYIKGDDDKATKLHDFCKNYLIQNNFVSKNIMSATELLEVQQKLSILQTRCQGLDYLLDGGIRSKVMTEFYGENGSGKSQLGHLLAILAQLPVEEGGLKNSDNTPIVVIIDTENKYSTRRIMQIAVARGLAEDEEDAKKFTNNIKIMLPKTVSEQLYMIGLIRQWLSSKLNIRLLIIDSATALIRAEMSERNVSWMKKDVMNSMFLQLRGIAEVFDIPIVVMNQIYNSPDVSFGDNDIPYGGHIFGHAISTVIKFEKTNGHIEVKGKRYLKHKARCIKSPLRGEEEIQFYINETGLVSI